MKWKIIIISTIFLLIVVSSSFIFLLQAPNDFPVNSIYTVEKGTGINSLASDLFTKKIIKSPFLFKTFSVLFGGSKAIIAGDYSLNNKEGLIKMVNRFSAGDFKLIPIKITIPEGLNVFEVSKLVAKKFPKIDEKSFLKLAEKEEGYLFPDTYLFLPNVSAEEIIKVMKDTFQEKILTLNIDIKDFNKPLTDIIKMASIIEEEARTTETRRIVVGILWTRLSIGMPLQVDASFKYINGKGTSDLTLSDLKIDSAYNSYLYKGLPPTPISNPGLEAIKATINPIKTDYLYFLSDSNGDMHYAKTFSEHIRNKELYLK